MIVECVGATIELDESLVDASPSEIRMQVSAYERGERQELDLPVRLPNGFLGEVMAAMCEIPYGDTRTYGELADDLETAPVAVGQACARNPVPLVVPCHRVVGSDEGLGGYSASGGVETKRQLLDLEGDSVQTGLPTE